MAYKYFCKFQIGPLTPTSRPSTEKALYISLTIGSKTSKCEDNLQDVMACDSFTRGEFELEDIFEKY